MKIAVCLDDRDGMMFGSRRQSMDCVQRQMLLELVAGETLWMNGYTAGMFDELAENLMVEDDFLGKAGVEDWCFVENVDVTPYMDRITRLVIYRWNRVYPATMKFPVSQFENMGLVSRRDVPGNSHEWITEEVYAR